MTAAALTAVHAGLVGCHECGLVSKLPPAKGHGRASCPRCGADLHSRKPNSIARTWALLIAALVLYIPANVLPIMTTTTLGHSQSDTIMSGVIYFIVTGSWGLAAVIFTASVVVPVAKLIVLSYLLISVQRGSRWRRGDRTRLYRVTEVIGPWSMVDVYVVTIMVALVQIQSLATIEAQPGAMFFGAVVVLTMFAAMAFDSRLIWDAAEESNDR